MFDNINSILKEECAVDSDRQIIVGVSGGPDSMCLLHILSGEGYKVIAAHFNHMLRPDAEDDAHEVESVAMRLDVPFVAESGNVQEYAEANNLSIEEAARFMRYRFLMKQAQEHNAQAVAVGHTADDQVETVLMHFLRGAGLFGLKGMQYRTIIPMFDAQIPVIRPLLDAWREDTVHYCAVHEINPRYDPTNSTAEFSRNRIRNLLIPSLESYNPRFKDAVWRTSRVLADDHAILMKVLDNAWKQCVTQETPEFVAFETAALEKNHPAIQRNLVRRAMQILRLDGMEVTFAVLDRAAGFIADETAARRVDLTGGLFLLREGLLIYVVNDPSNLPFDFWPQMPNDKNSLSIEVPDSIPLSDGWKIHCNYGDISSSAIQKAKENENPYQTWMDADRLRGALMLRVRHDGDRFQPIGLEGHQVKLSDFFINAKLPQRARDRWPLLCLGDDIVWVPGYRPAHNVRLTETTKKVLYFLITK